MFLRMIKLHIRQNRQLEDARQALFQHKTFSLEESFKLFDINENGTVCINEVQQVFSKFNIEVSDCARLVELLDTDEDGSI